MIRFKKLFLKIINPLILWCFGWKRIKEVYMLRGFPITSTILWKDPEDKYGWISAEQAIEICERRANKKL